MLGVDVEVDANHFVTTFASWEWEIVTNQKLKGVALYELG